VPDQAGRPGTVATAGQWHADIGRPPECTPAASCGGTGLRRFRDILPDIDQPPLRENLLALHLGGAKRVIRCSGGNREVHDVELGSMTVMLAFEPNRWSTEGPVDFAHLTLSLGLLRQTAVEEFDRDPGDLQLLCAVGQRNAAVETCFAALLADGDRPQPGRLYREGLLAVISFNLVRHHSTLSPTLPEPAAGARSGRLAKGGLAAWQLRRVVDYMQDNLASDIGVDGELTGLTGLSRAQFFRAFRRSTGRSPHAYLNDLRIRHARQLLRATDLPTSEVAPAVGLSRAQLSELFREHFGVLPTAQGCRGARPS